MKAASLRDIKSELQFKSKDELMELCLLMTKFKKDNKELLTYLLNCGFMIFSVPTTTEKSQRHMELLEHK